MRVFISDCIGDSYSIIFRTHSFPPGPEIWQAVLPIKESFHYVK